MWWLIGAIAIVLLAFSPVIPLFILDWLGLADGLNESNSIIGVIPWMLFFTLPAGLLSLIAWAAYGIVKLLSGIDHGEN